MDINITILFQLAIFLVVLATLTSILFKPFMRVIEARYQKIHGTRAEVDRFSRLAGENEAAYESRMREARNVARQEREALRAAGNDEKRKMLAEVRSEIARALNETRERVSRDEEAARQTLQRQTDVLAGQVVSKIIGREVAS